MPTVEKIYAPNVYPFPPVAIPPAAAMDDEGAVDEDVEAKVARLAFPTLAPVAANL